MSVYYQPRMHEYQIPETTPRHDVGMANKSGTKGYLMVSGIFTNKMNTQFIQLNLNNQI